MGKFIDISGQRFGMLTVTKRVENDLRMDKSGTN